LSHQIFSATKGKTQDPDLPKGIPSTLCSGVLIIKKIFKPMRYYDPDELQGRLKESVALAESIIA